MIQVLGRSSGNLVKVEASAPISDDEVGSLETKLRKLVDEHGKLRILLEVRDAKAWQRAAEAEGEEPLRIDSDRDVERLAILCDEDAAEPARQLFGAISAASTRRFPLRREQEAWNWLSGVPLAGAAQPGSQPGS